MTSGALPASRGNEMKIFDWTAAGRLLGLFVGFFGFYFLAVTCFPPENEVDSMMRVVPFFVSACVSAITTAWVLGRLFGRLSREKRQQ